LRGASHALPIGAAVGLCMMALTAATLAQELEPRAYSASPIGLNFAGIGFSYSSGDVVTDPTLPVTNVSAHIYGSAAAYGRTFGLLGRQALVTVSLPYAWGDAEGDVGEQHARIRRSGLTDFRAKFAINLYGNPAATPQEFARREQSVIIGASMFVTAPTGQYDSAKLINLGTNRWSIRPEVGLSVPWRKFYFDVYAGVTFFTENMHYYPGTATRSQDPLTSIQFHASYTFRPSFWVAFDSTWYGGGAASVNGGPSTARQNNSRGGVTVSIPVAKHQSVKLAYSRGAFVRAGQNFTTYAAAWQIAWF